MPIIRGPLDAQGHASVQALVYPPAPRRRALQQAGQPVPAATPSVGMIDTGATITVIDPHIRQALGLTPFRIRTAQVPSQTTSVQVYLYKVDLFILHPTDPPNSLFVQTLSVFEAPLSHMGLDVLVGCDVLSKCAFFHDGQGGGFVLSY